MSDIVLRGLLLPDNRNQVSSTSNTNNNSVLKSLQLDEPETQGAQSLSMADSLKLSENTGSSSKGSVPIQLMAPTDINSGTTKKLTKLNSKFNELISLQSTPRPSRTQGDRSNPTLTGLSASAKPNTGNYSVSSNTSYSQTSSNGTKVSGSYSTTMTGNIGTVSRGDKVGDKINSAIEKIQTWDRKIGILDSELNKQKSGSVDNARLISRTSQMVTAKKDAVVSREDALRAYTDVMKEINSSFSSTNTNSFSQYKNSYLRMESMFAAASERDKGMMAKTMDFLKGSMTADNFNKALDYLNPFR